MNENEVMKCLTSRRSCRSYSDKKVSLDIVQKILEAGAFAPSGMGMQSATMVAIQNEALIDEMEQKNAAVMNNPGSHPFYGAKTVILVLADPDRSTWMEDGSLAMGNMLNAAHALGVNACWIHRAREEFDSPWGKALLRKWGLPEKLRGIGHCILGYDAGNGIREAKPRRTDSVLIIP